MDPKYVGEVNRGVAPARPGEFAPVQLGDLRIETPVILAPMAGITNDVPAGSRMIGIPATPEREQKIKLASLSKLPEMRRQMKKLQATVNRLVEQLEAGDESAGRDDPPRRAVA